MQFKNYHTCADLKPHIQVKYMLKPSTRMTF